MHAQPVREPVDALFVAYETQENLGVRSLMAVLDEAGNVQPPNEIGEIALWRDGKWVRIVDSA